MNEADGFICAIERHDTAFRIGWPKLHQIASRLLRREYACHSIQTTALICDAYVKWRANPFQPRNMAHFSSMLARLMKQILIDRSRTRKPLPISIDELGETLLPDSRARDARGAPERAIDVRRAFERLQTHDKLAAETLWLRSIEGMTIAEVAALQNRQPWKVQADEDFALDWMRQRV